MKSQISINSDQTVLVDFSQPIDISIPLKHGDENPNCYYADPVQFEVIRSGSFIGSVQEGGTVNYQKVSFTPHGNGTHTECVGHISADESLTLNACLHQFHFLAQLISIPVKNKGDDSVLRYEDFKDKLDLAGCQAVIIRSMPNPEIKKQMQYSGTNPPYLDHRILHYLAQNGVMHVLVDLPSLDKEHDNGKLLAHKAFWNYPEAIRINATVTELIYVPDEVADGLYFLNLQVASFNCDASPSKPVIYKILKS